MPADRIAVLWTPPSTKTILESGEAISWTTYDSGIGQRGYLLASDAEDLKREMPGIKLSGIMFIAVRERMKEIGIRSSLGAAPSEIIGQFMLEVVALSLVGGIGGIVLAAAIFGLISPMDLPRAAGIGAYLKATGLSITLGIIAGCYPAIQAGLKSPVMFL